MSCFASSGTRHTRDFMAALFLVVVCMMSLYFDIWDSDIRDKARFAIVEIPSFNGYDEVDFGITLPILATGFI